MIKSSVLSVPAPSSTREAILKAATALFAQKGMNGTTTREIADRAGVNIAALHYHWGGKEDLLKAVYEKVNQEVIALATQIFSRPVAGLKEAIRQYLGQFHDFFVANPDYPRILLYGELENPPFLRELRRQFTAPLTAQVSAQMKSLMKQKKIRKVDPEAILISFYGFLLIQFANLPAQQAA